ncbi:hypothetical protein VCNHCC008D_002918A, partial [Vibrio cholerae O1 str. NHCC-008D]
MVYIVKERF